MLLHSLLEQQVNYDEDIPPSDPPNNMQGPMTRARMRQLNLQVSSFLSDPFHTFKNRLLPNDVIFFRNIREGHKELGGRVSTEYHRQSSEGYPTKVD